MKIKSLATYFLLVCGQQLFAAPARVTDLVAVATNGGVILSWTAPAPSEVTTLTNLDVRYSTSPINTLNWASRPRVLWLNNPGTPTTMQAAVVTELVSGTTYYFALKTQDSLGTWSTISTLAVATTGGAVYSIEVGWNPMDDPTVNGFVVYIGTESGNYFTSVNVEKTTRATINGLEWGVTYYFVVTARNVYGLESGYSEEISYKKP